MYQLIRSLLLVCFLQIGIDAANDKQKLVCSQPDGTFEGPRGFCSKADDNQKTCSCSDDCAQALSLSDCICTRDDLKYAQDQGLANCSIYTQIQWNAYVRAARGAFGYGVLPPASNTPDGHGLLFVTHDEGLAWPITDGKEIGGLLEHGPHCVKMIKMFNQVILDFGPLNNSIDSSHYDHCRRLLRRVLAYFTDVEPDYQILPKTLCDDFHLNGLQSRRAAETVSYKIEYKRSLAVDAADKNKYKDKYHAQASRSALDDTIKQANDLYDDLRKELIDEIGKNVSQQQLLDRISGQNLGDLLVKNWLEEPLTPAEGTIIQNWESERVLHIAVLGIYCIQGKGSSAPVDELRALLTAPLI